jgi:hypothetical protein
MKVYVVIKGYEYEGYSCPAAAFSDLNDAKRFVGSMERGCADYVDVYALELDEASDKSGEYEAVYEFKHPWVPPILWEPPKG